MKVLFSREGKSLCLKDKARLIFRLDDCLVNEYGEEVQPEDSYTGVNDTPDNNQWYKYWMEYEGIDEPLKSESVIEPEKEIDDVFGKYGFVNEVGEFVIEPQYAYAYEFTNGLAAVNLNRTWYRTEEGHRYYENHYGYIDEKGKTVIGFQYDEAYPFNKYGVAVVSDLESGWKLIDKKGNEIPGTRFEYISHYYDYDERFLEFSYEQQNGDELVGIYDTKERKILMEPSIDSIIEWDEDCILVYERNGEYGISDFCQYYINSNGEILYPWLYNKGFAIVERPDINKVTGVAISEYTELSGNPRSYYPFNGKKYERNFIYGLYSSMGRFVLPMEYEEIKRLSDDIWSCYKDGTFMVIKTEVDD